MRSKTGVLLPLYSHPDSGWELVLKERIDHPGVPLVVIVNPCSGPGRTEDPTYASWIERLKSAGIAVLGYVYTGYGTRAFGTAASEVESYKDWYKVVGVFLDEMPNVAGRETYYSRLSDHARSIGLSMTFGNPGTSPHPGYLGTVDCIVVYEGPGLPRTSSPVARRPGYDKFKFASLSYAVSATEISGLGDLTPQLGYINMTDGTLPNPYCSLPTYLPRFVSALDALDS